MASDRTRVGPRVVVASAAMLDRARADVLKNNWPADQEEPITIVVLPEFVARHWWERLLYNQAGRCLKAVIADVPYGRER